MKSDSKWAAWLAGTVAILGLMVFPYFGHVGPKASLAGHGRPKAPVI